MTTLSVGLFDDTDDRQCLMFTLKAASDTSTPIAFICRATGGQADGGGERQVGGGGGGGQRCFCLCCPPYRRCHCEWRTPFDCEVRRFLSQIGGWRKQQTARGAPIHMSSTHFYPLPLLSTKFENHLSTSVRSLWTSPFLFLQGRHTWRPQREQMCHLVFVRVGWVARNRFSDGRTPQPFAFVPLLDHQIGRKEVCLPRIMHSPELIMHRTLLSLSNRGSAH